MNNAKSDGEGKGSGSSNGTLRICRQSYQLAKWQSLSKLRKILIILASWSALTLVFLLLICLVYAQEKETPEIHNMKMLKIEWYRLLTDGQTCPRCGATEKEVEKASHSLEQSLAPLGIKVVLEKHELTPGAFQQDHSKSNRILLNGSPLEEWLGLKVGQSLCCGPCGDAECRTLETRGQVYETIPADLIIQAGLQAGAKLVNPQAVDPCCQKDAPVKTATPACCPK